MARDNGEFELILGNKQLLSVLFIVIVLLGVFFALGFLAGRTTAGNRAMAMASNTPPPSPLVVGSSDNKDIPLAEPKKSKDLLEEPAKRESKKTEPVEEAKSKAEPKKEEPPKKVEKPAPVQAAAVGGFTESPPSGTYLQAAATRRADADNLLGLLGRHGLSGFVTPVPKKADLFRVIIGPLLDSEQIADTREKLKKANIEKAFIVKY